MEVTHEASTAMGMAFTSWGMSRGKVYELHLRIHDHGGLPSSDSGQIVGEGGAKFAYRSQELGHGSGP